jgi:hypothetical protein
MLKFLTASVFLLAGTALADDQSKILQSAPMRFEPASTGPFQWSARGAGYAIAFAPEQTVLAVGERAVRMRFADANPKAAFQPTERSPVDTSYIHAKTRRSLPAYGKLRQSDVYHGIDVVYYGNGQNLEYDFELAPGADASVIAIRFEGAARVSLNERGDVVLTAGDREITQKLPSVYQRTGPDEITTVPASYRLDGNGLVRFHLESYDAAKPLVIDPSIVLTGYYPGTGAEGVVGIARDAQGLLYMAGYTFSTDFALVGDVYSYILRNGLREAWISKIDPAKSGNDLILYSSFFGSSATDDPRALAVDNAGLVYLTGITDSFDFPTTPSGFLTGFPGGTKKIFISVLDTTQGANGLLYSTLFGGSQIDEPTGITVAGGKIYLTGFTTSGDFPVGAALNTTRQGSYDGFISILDPNQSGYASLLYSTYYGGSGQDLSRSIAVDGAGIVYIAGITYSADFPTTLTALQRAYSGLGDAFFVKLDTSSNTILYSTYLGGSDTDQAMKILVQTDGRVGITGYTFSYDHPVTQNAVQPIYNGGADIFLTILDPQSTSSAGSLVYSTFFGGSGGDVPYDLRRDSSGKYYLCGYTSSRDFPVRNALNPESARAGTDAFVSIIDPAAPPASALTYSSYITGPGTQVAYGLDVSANGMVTVTGVTTGLLFPPGQAAPVIPSNTNVFLLEFQP